MTGSYSPPLVFLSFVIAAVASFVALDLGARVAQTTGLLRRFWLFGGAVMMGIGIWSMHFVGMLAFSMPMPMTYDLGVTLLSMLVAILASGLALFIVGLPTPGRPRLLLGGLFMGVGIASMHYIGMEAMRMQAVLSYDLRLVALSVLIAIAASWAALWLARRFRRETESPFGPVKLVSATAMGVAIAGMHYVGMAAAIFAPAPQIPASIVNAGVPIGGLGATAIGIGTLGALGLTVMSTLVDAERKRSERHLWFLIHVTTTLFQELDRAALLKRVCQLVTPTLGDCCFIDRREEAPWPPLFEQRAASRRAAVLPELTPARLGAFDSLPGREAAIRECGAVSLLLAPISQRGEVVAMLTLVSSTSRRIYTESDLPLVEEFCHRVENALENARLLREAQEAAQAAQEALAARDEFLSVASHELRTPLTSLRLMLANLHRQTRGAPTVPSERLDVMLASLDRQTKRLSRLVEELLDVTRITAGKLHLEREPVDLAEVAREVIQRLSPQLVDAGCEANLRVDAPVVGLWDPLRLDQVVTNLLANAVKYAPGKPVEVSVSTDRETAILKVRDEGIGIAPAEQARIFERFERAVPLRNYGGLGLGLFITRQIVEAHGGTISVVSEPGHGAEFTVRLPIEAVEARRPADVGAQ